MRANRVAATLFNIAALALAGFAHAGELDVAIQPVGLDEKSNDILLKLVLDLPEVRARLQGARFRVLEARFGSADPAKELDASDQEAAQRYQFKIFDYTHNQLLEVSGVLSDRFTPSRPRIAPASRNDAPPPSPEEIDDALQILRQDPYFGAPERAGAWTHYAAMPGLLQPDALLALPSDPLPPSADRVIAIGLLPKESLDCAATGDCSHVGSDADFHHEIVGVNLSRGAVIRFPAGAPPTALATAIVCAPPSARQYVTARGTSGQANITVNRDGQELWRFLAVRPSASSGYWGSGIDLRNLHFKGKRVLSQLHVPILNVQYAQNRCGPYRDWQYSESYIKATGSMLAAGIVRSTTEPQTIFESGSDAGNFRGVAVYTQGTTTILRAELEAGWYRYKTEYLFQEDGTIQPRWGFSAVQDSCTCYTHTHHAYWRMDFDVGTSYANTVQYFDGSAWLDVPTEARHKRDGAHRRWRVMAADGTGYEILPGSDDGTADAYGRGDAWILRFTQGQLDDSSVYAGTPANLDAFVSGAATTRQDVVFWYGAHFRHSQDGSPMDEGHILGPTLKPIGW